MVVDEVTVQGVNGEASLSMEKIVPSHPRAAPPLTQSWLVVQLDAEVEIVGGVHGMDTASAGAGALNATTGATHAAPRINVRRFNPESPNLVMMKT